MINKIDIRLFLGILSGIFLLYYFLPMEQGLKAFDELALGAQTTSNYGQTDTFAVHCKDLTDLEKCLKTYEDGGSNQQVLLWLGNSQLHSINQFNLGEETAALELHRKFQESSEYFLTLSQPNASLQEHYLLFAYMLNMLPIEGLVLPVVFDDMREDGIRSSLIDIFRDQKTRQDLSASEIGRNLIRNHGDQGSAGSDMAALRDTLQERSERSLNSFLEDHWSVWSERPALRGTIFNWLYQFRNRALRINPSSTRRIIPGRYAKNRDALLAILKLATQRQVKVLLYVVPLRNDVKTPYDSGEYASFKAEMTMLALQNDARFADLGELVPADLWGTKDATATGGGQELDFMHFRAGGHRLLAKALYKELKTEEPTL